MLNDFKNKHKGETALIIGNGPSLEGMPLLELSGKYITFGSNKIYDYPFMPNFWACADALMLHDCIPWIVAHPEYLSEKFVPRDIPLPGAHPMTLTIDVKFSTDAAREMFMGGTVSYIQMQLAHYMGFDRLLLVGMDHRYKKTEKGGQPGSRFIANGEDPDHFKTKEKFAYFTPGRIYSRPELEATERFFYPLALKNFGDIINLTPDSALTIFKKDKVEKYI